FCLCSYHTDTSEIYTLSLHDALPIWIVVAHSGLQQAFRIARRGRCANFQARHTGVKIFRRVRMRSAELVCGSVRAAKRDGNIERSEEHTSELQSPYDLVCRLLLEKKK